MQQPVTVPKRGAASRSSSYEAAQAAWSDPHAEEEWGRLLDEKRDNEQRRSSRDFKIAMSVIAALVLGGIGWFASDGTRLKAFSFTVAEIESMGDIEDVMDDYHESLYKISVRDAQINQAAAALGAAFGGHEAPGDGRMEAEMDAFTGRDDGQSLVRRNQVLHSKINQARKAAGKSATAGPGDGARRKFEQENAFDLGD